MSPFLDIIIVNWNSGNWLRECLKSIISVEYNGFELSRVAVVDNASSDASVDDLKTLSLPLTIICNPENRGFAAACNQGARGSTSDYILFLNPDTQMFTDSLCKPINFMQQTENSKIGICGIQLIDGEGHASHTCARFPTPKLFFSKMLGLHRLFPKIFSTYLLDEWDHTDNRAVDHVMGSFYLVRRKIFESLGGFDERFFVYLEDLDFSYRAKKYGWSSYYLAEAQIFHKGGGASEKVKAARLFYSLHSRIVYVHKHFDWRLATVLTIGTLIFEPIARLVLASARFSSKEMLETLKGYWMLWGTFPKLLRMAWKRSKYENSSAQPLRPTGRQ